MKIGKAKLEELEQLASLQFTIDEIATALELNSTYLKKSILSKQSQAYKYYERGRLKAEAEIRTAIFKMAKQGSTPAQKQMIELIQLNKEYITDSDSRRRRDEAEFKLKNLEYETKSGKLIDREEAIRTGTAVITVAKTKLLGIPNKVAPRIIGERSIRKIKNILQKEITEALNELANLKILSD